MKKSYILLSAIESQELNRTKRSNKELGKGSNWQATLAIYTPNPLSYMMEHFFREPQYYEALDKAYGLNSIKN